MWGTGWHTRAAILSVVLLIVVAVFATLQLEGFEADRRDGENGAILSAHSNEPEGARALVLWLRELGYRPTTLEYRAFQLDHGQPLLFMLYPTDVVKDEHVAEVLAWVEHGGTLVVVPGDFDAWLKPVGISGSDPGAVSSPTLTGVPLQPLQQPSVRSVSVEAGSQLNLLDPMWVPLLGVSDRTERVVAATRTYGEGRIFVVSSWRLLSNDGLRHPGNGAFVLHLLGGVPAGSTVVFDEYHHGYTEHGTLYVRLVREPWGWAVLSAAAIVLTYLALAGRRFGPALPPHAETARRARAEFATTLAGLLRRGNHRDWLRQQYRSQVRRALGRRFRVRADLPVPEFVARLAAQRPDAESLTDPLWRLEGDIRDDATLIAVMRQVESLRAHLLGLRPLPRVKTNVSEQAAAEAAGSHTNRRPAAR